MQITYKPDPEANKEFESLAISKWLLYVCQGSIDVEPWVKEMVRQYYGVKNGKLIRRK